MHERNLHRMAGMGGGLSTLLITFVFDENGHSHRVRNSVILKLIPEPVKISDSLRRRPEVPRRTEVVADRSRVGPPRPLPLLLDAERFEMQRHFDAMTNDQTTPGHEREARTFIVLAIAAGFTSWDVGFDLGAFDNIDHRRVWAIWILCTVAFVTSFLFASAELEQIRKWRWVLAVPSLWLVADFFLVSGSDTIVIALIIVSIATLPIALYVLVRLFAGDFFTLGRRSQIVLVAMSAVILCTGMYVGAGHVRFLTCEDFARSGDFVPTDCVSADS